LRLHITCIIEILIKLNSYFCKEATHAYKTSSSDLNTRGKGWPSCEAARFLAVAGSSLTASRAAVGHKARVNFLVVLRLQRLCFDVLTNFFWTCIALKKEENSVLCEPWAATSNHWAALAERRSMSLCQIYVFLLNFVYKFPKFVHKIHTYKSISSSSKNLSNFSLVRYFIKKKIKKLVRIYMLNSV